MGKIFKKIFLSEASRGHDHMVGSSLVGFTTTCVITAYHHLSCEFEPCRWRGVLDTSLCVIKFVGNLRQVGGFLRVSSTN